MAPHAPAPRGSIENYATRPDREIPRNEKGEIVCRHDDCKTRTETFRRPCEWNKHMDKHERPYKCQEPACDQNPGFTYSGGLLRHMREVHKAGIGARRQPLYCPHNNCVRSSGDGFTRRENLDEHLRRRHSHQGPYSPKSTDSPTGSVTDENEPAKKRRKLSNSDQAAVAGEATATEDDEQQQASQASTPSAANGNEDRSQTSVGPSGDPQDERVRELHRQVQRKQNVIQRQEHIILQQKIELERLREDLSRLSSGKTNHTNADSTAPQSHPDKQASEADEPVEPTETNEATNGS